MSNIGVALALIVIVVLVCSGLTLLGVGIGFVLMKIIPGIDKGAGIVAGAIFAVGTIHFVIKAFTSKADNIWEIHEDEEIVNEPMYFSRKKKRKR